MQAMELRALAINEEIDYPFLKDALSAYSRPRDKITLLLESRVLIRVKKGLYVFGESVSLKPYQKETLANLIYGPSAISFEYALWFHGLTSVCPDSIASINNKRDKMFETPIGTFTYRYLNAAKYAMGITQIELDPTHPILIATAEKAIADVLLFLPEKTRLSSKDEWDFLLFDHLKINPEKLAHLNREKLKRIGTVYECNRISRFLNYLG